MLTYSSKWNTVPQLSCLDYPWNGIMSKSIQVIERTVDVLFVLGASKDGLGVTEIAASAQLSKSTVHRILAALSNKMMVQQDSNSKRYLLGPKVFELAHFFPSQLDLVTPAQSLLRLLRERFQETACLALRTGPSYLYVLTYPSPHEYRMNPAIGKAFPLHWTGFGKAILANLPEAELSAYLNQNTELVAATNRTLTSPDLLTEELKRIKAQGIAMSIGERVEGAVAIAAAIVNENKQPVGAIGLALPETRLAQLDQDNVAQELTAAAQGLSAAAALNPL
jgi:IclR family acetate operon transcriptional repressor